MVDDRKSPFRVPDQPELDRQLNQNRFAGQQTQRQMNQLPFFKGSYIKGIDFHTALTGIEVGHKLGAVPQGWLILRNFPTVGATGPAAVMEVYKTDVLIIMVVSQPCLMDIWFF